jgi:hypothetical protein
VNTKFLVPEIIANKKVDSRGTAVSRKLRHMVWRGRGCGMGEKVV